jgi:hypothetical protein
MLARLRKLVFGISLEETTFARRGFHEGDVHVRRRLERIGETFLFGYHAALEASNPDLLHHSLQKVEPELCGFAFEGAAMALTLRDHLMPWPRAGKQLQVFLDGPGMAHVYMVHVGVGWALARLPWRTQWPPPWLDPLLRWLVIDGYGFHEGYFYWRRYIKEQAKPKRLSGYASRVFDQGLGRSLWFVEGADVARILKTISAFPPARQADLWSGVGLACTYAGGLDGTQIMALRAAAGPFQPCLAQGAAFAAKARQRAGNPASHTALACEIFCGLSVAAAANVTDQALVDLPPDGFEPAYESWRRRIQAQFVHEEVQ